MLELCTTEIITSFQEQVAKTMLKANILSWFVSQDVVSSFNVFVLEKVPAADSLDLVHYGEDSVDLLLAVQSINGDEYLGVILYYCIYSH